MSEPTYSCAEAFARIQDFLDRELTAEEISCVEKHLKRCPECEDEFVFEGSVLRCLKRKLCDEPLPPGLEATVIERIRRECCD